MAHELDFDALGNARMFSVKQVPWHQLGTVLQDPPTSSEAIVQAKMNWLVLKRKLHWEVSSNVDAIKLQPVPGKIALVRNEDEKFLAVVSDQYEPLQNEDAFKFFDPLVNRGIAAYESAGVIKEGKRVWIQAALKESLQINGDEMKRYILLTNGHDGKMGVTVSPCNVRVVCANTMRMALAEGNIQWSSHFGDVAPRFKKLEDFFGAIIQQFEAEDEALKYLGTVSMNHEDYIKFLDKLLDMPVNSDLPLDDEAQMATIESEVKRKQSMKLTLLELRATGQGVTDITKTTAYGAFNAVAEFVDYYMGPRVKDRVSYALFGDGAALRERALQLLLPDSEIE